MPPSASRRNVGNKCRNTDPAEENANLKDITTNKFHRSLTVKCCEIEIPLNF